MLAQPSEADLRFVERFEAGEVDPGSFHHREHLRLAYTYLTTCSRSAARTRMRSQIQSFLERNAVDPGKYHETMTMAWMDAVRHFIELAVAADSFDAFVQADPRVLDQSIMLTHYSRETLFSSAARTAYLAPDIDPIPCC